MKAAYQAGLVDGLFAPEHRERMGEAVWLFGWLVARQTAQKDAVGFVLGGDGRVIRRTRKGKGGKKAVRYIPISPRNNC